MKDLVNPRKKFRFTKRKPEIFAKKNQQTTSISQSLLENSYLTQAVDFAASIPGFVDLQGKKLTPTRQELQGTYKLYNLDNCEIQLNTIFEAVYIKNIKNSKIVIGPVKSSVFIDDCQNSQLLIAAHQIRIHNSNQC